MGIMSTTPLQLLGNLTPATFLADYWQKKPLLIRNAIPGFSSPIDPDELAGLACEPEVESRLILERDGPSPWTLEHGPFDEHRFAGLPESHWTLLVQECNKYVPELAKLIEEFNFIPGWRVDDVMVSYAPDQGTVGPHTDQYDVFLLQGLGTRRWQISTSPVDSNNFIPNLDLNIMSTFQPTEEWILEAGDMLYLPPGIAHQGVALEDCITLSVGFRAPSFADIISGFCDDAASQYTNRQRYTDPDLQLQKHPGEITGEALSKVHSIIQAASADTNAINGWFGRFITESKSGEPILEPETKLSKGEFISRFREYGQLVRSEYARFAFINQNGSCLLFIDGQEFPLSKDLAFAAPLLCDQRFLSYNELDNKITINNFTLLLTELYNAGYVTFVE